MKIVNVYDIGFVQSHDVSLKLLDIDVLGCSLHHNTDDILDDGECCCHDDYRKEICAEWIRVPERRIEINKEGSNNDTYRHEHIAEHV